MFETDVVNEKAAGFVGDLAPANIFSNSRGGMDVQFKKTPTQVARLASRRSSGRRS